MRKFLHSRSFIVLVAFVLIVGALVALYQTVGKTPPQLVVAHVSRGEVSTIVSVSGIVEARNSASLAFKASGIVNQILVQEGDVVLKNDLLATLEQAELLAERRDAAAALLKAEADREELINGPRSEEREVTNTAVAIAEAELTRTIEEEKEKVENARRIFLSSGLEAIAVNKNYDAEPPVVSGTYTCDVEGTYTLSVFRSGAHSGYSYRLSGLESGLYTAYADSPAPFGTCGLSIQFIDDENYGNNDWTITIPNPRSSVYVANYNAYQLALKQEKNNITEKEHALDLALHEATLENAEPRSEELKRANADVMQTEARLAAVEARLADRTLRAPFAGTISNIDAVVGETVSVLPIIELVADDVFELKARIPEIDITKLTLGQRAEVVFDARSGEVVVATISFISPLAVEIDGVAYFDATLSFDEPPQWLRGGLNADIDIIIEKKDDVLRLPERFVSSTNDKHYVLVPTEDGVATTAVEVGFSGNDGFVEVTGLAEGTVVVAPE